jgi:hypothetical protein
MDCTSPEQSNERPENEVINANNAATCTGAAGYFCGSSRCYFTDASCAMYHFVSIDCFHNPLKCFLVAIQKSEMERYERIAYHTLITSRHTLNLCLLRIESLTAISAKVTIELLCGQWKCLKQKKRIFRVFKDFL